MCRFCACDTKKLRMSNNLALRLLFLVRGVFLMRRYSDQPSKAQSRVLHFFLRVIGTCAYLRYIPASPTNRPLQTGRDLCLLDRCSSSNSHNMQQHFSTPGRLVHARIYLLELCEPQMHFLHLSKYRAQPRMLYLVVVRHYR